MCGMGRNAEKLKQGLVNAGFASIERTLVWGMRGDWVVTEDIVEVEGR